MKHTHYHTKIVFVVYAIFKIQYNINLSNLNLITIEYFQTSIKKFTTSITYTS
jgi:hypothetical protein